MSTTQENTLSVKEEKQTLTRSELVSALKEKAEQWQLDESDVELAVTSIVNNISDAVVNGDRVEIRGFGSLTLHHRQARMGRNPKTGEDVYVAEKYVPYFKPGAILRSRIDNKGEDK